MAYKTIVSLDGMMSLFMCMFYHLDFTFPLDTESFLFAQSWARFEIVDAIGTNSHFTRASHIRNKTNNLVSHTGPGITGMDRIVTWASA